LDTGGTTTGTASTTSTTTGATAAATGSLQNISPSAGGSPGSTGSTGPGTDSAAGPTGADETANYVAQNTGTVVLTHNQPQSSGNAKPTGVPNLLLHANNGLGGGSSSDDSGGVLNNAPSF
jgi:hypothetical protein